MKKILPYDVVKQLIQKSGFGTYTLFVMPDNNKVGGSHLLADKDDDGKMTSDNLVIDLESHVDLLGNGLYRIILKKSNKSQAGTEVCYFFEVREGVESGGSPTAGNGYAGLGADKIDEMVTTRVNQLMEAKEKELKAQREMDVLKAEIETLKKRKAPTRKKSELAGVLNLALVGGSAFIVEQWPNSKPIVEKALAAISAAAEEEEEEEEETGFTVVE